MDGIGRNSLGFSARVEDAEAELAVTRVADWLDWLEIEQDRIGGALGWLLEP